MPIVTNVRCFNGYPCPRVGEDLQKLLLANGGRGSSNLIRLECFLHLTDQRLDLELARTARGRRILEAFVAANYSPAFCELEHPWQLRRDLEQTLTSASVEISLPAPATLNRTSWPNRFRKAVTDFERRSFDDEVLEFWRGWTLHNITGDQMSLVLWPISLRCGADITSGFYGGCVEWLRGRRTHLLPLVNDLARYIGSYKGLLSFGNSSDVGIFLRAFFHHHFRSAEKDGHSLASASHQWRDFAKFLNDHILGHRWATPIPALPQPRALNVFGTDTNVRTRSDGVRVKSSLLTDIPLTLSDEETKELLFAQVKSDRDTLLDMARAEVVATRIRLGRRKELALIGTPNCVGPTGVNSGANWLVDQSNPDCLANACATFETRGFQIRKGERMLYPGPTDAISWELALPLHKLVLAHAIVLVSNHPAITAAFLDDLQLYDKDGARTGFITTDAGKFLVGLKMRKGAERAQQRILLNRETIEVIEDLIELTEPVREVLRKRGDDRWRCLILTVKSIGLMPPKRNNIAREANRYSEWVAECLRRNGVDDEKATFLAQRFSPKRLRSTAAVLIYIETGSVERMAQALGHETWNPRLLDRYLPRVVQEFFVERWVRIAQQGIVCEALKNSPYLLAASGFTSMSDLDRFLEHHAFRALPRHLEDPDAGPCEEEAPGTSVVFGVALGILTILIALQIAVRSSQRQPNVRAVHWARIGEKLVAHLETQVEQPELRDMVAEARAHANTSFVEGLIYA